VATPGTRAVRVDTRAMCHFRRGSLRHRCWSFGTKTTPPARSPMGGAERSCSEVAAVFHPKVGVVTKGRGRKVLFGGVDVRPNGGRHGWWFRLGNPVVVLRLFAGMVRAPRGSSRQRLVTPNFDRIGKPVRL
jgi:hypothetical protein